jgi:DNA-directed RNA polymerase subunit RPC12/RpoP
MEKSISAIKLSDEYYYLKDEHEHSGFKCDECGKEFQKPIVATILSNVDTQRYYACPRCLTKVSVIEKQRSMENREEGFQTRETRKTASKLDEDVKCNHFLGYLKKRPRNDPFPEDCLTCSKMIECLAR